MVFEHSQFDQILKAYVDDQGLVDYNAIARDTRFQTYMEQLKTAATDEMRSDGRLAFWINAYNAVTIDKVIRWKPKKSVRETAIRGLWTSTKFFTSREHMVAGKQMSQDDIEHEILRKQFNDPRIHFAIVCASSSCPKLARYAFSEAHVQRQLEEETRKYITSDRGTRIDYAENMNVYMLEPDGVYLRKFDGRMAARLERENIRPIFVGGSKEELVVLQEKAFMLPLYANLRKRQAAKFHITPLRAIHKALKTVKAVAVSNDVALRDLRTRKPKAALINAATRIAARAACQDTSSATSV